MPEDMPDTMPDRMPEDMSDRMPEDLPATKCTNVMVGITRSKVILKLPPPPCAVLLVPMFLSAQVSNGLECSLSAARQESRIGQARIFA